MAEIANMGYAVDEAEGFYSKEFHKFTIANMGYAVDGAEGFYSMTCPLAKNFINSRWFCIFMMLESILI